MDSMRLVRSPSIGFSTYLTITVNDCPEASLTLWFEAYHSDIFALATTNITSGVEEVGVSIGTGPVLRECSAHKGLCVVKCDNRCRDGRCPNGSQKWRQI